MPSGLPACLSMTMGTSLQVHQGVGWVAHMFAWSFACSSLSMYPQMCVEAVNSADQTGNVECSTFTKVTTTRVAHRTRTLCLSDPECRVIHAWPVLSPFSRHPSVPLWEGMRVILVEHGD
jgi:hypothetical protein